MQNRLDRHLSSVREIVIILGEIFQCPKASESGNFKLGYTKFPLFPMCWQSFMQGETFQKNILFIHLEQENIVLSFHILLLK